MLAVKTPKRLTREQSRKLTTARLREAAVEVFTERGFSGASVEEIAERAGYTRGAFYSNFESKDDIFLELFDQRLRARIEEVSAILRSASSLEEALQTLRGAARPDAETWMVLSKEFWLYAMRNPKARPKLAAHRRTERRAYERAIEAQFAAAGLPVPGPVEDLAIIIQALDDDLLALHAIDPKGVPKGFFFDALTMLFEAGVALARQREASSGNYQ